tara:strand:- start:9172 stop:10983 length:1812 start_codon:yes stop_codon:yes gene_type:complete
VPEKLGDAVLELRTDSTKLNKGLDQATIKTKKLDRQFQSTGKNLIKFASIATAAALAVSGVVRIVGDLVAAYGEQEDSEARLAAAIQATGKEAVISTAALHDMASELQEVTTFGDEVTISAIAMLQQLSDLGEQGLKQITPVMQDFAAAMRIDLNMAASLIGKTLGSTTNALSRYGIQVDATAPKSEKLAQLTEAMEEKFSGMARAMGKTTLGSIERLNNAMGDLKEEGGKQLLEILNPAITALTNFVTRTLQAWSAQRKLNEAMAGEVSSYVEAQNKIATLNEEIAKLKTLQLMSDADLAAELIKQKGIHAGAVNSLKTEREEIAIQIELTSQRLRLLDQQSAKLKEQEEIMAAEVTYSELLVSAKAAELEAEERIAKARAFEQERDDSLLDTLNEIALAREEAAEASIKFFANWESGTEKAIDSTKKLTKAMEGWLQPLSNFSNQAAMAMGALIVGGEDAAEAFKNAMKDALASAVEGLGQRLSAEAIGLWAASLIPGGQANIPAAIAMSAAATTAFLGAGIIRALAQGGDFFTSGPELMLVGDNPGGVERVRVDPVSSEANSAGDPLHITIFMDHQRMYDKITGAVRNRQITIDLGALTT